MTDIDVSLQTGTTNYNIEQLKKIPMGNFGDDINFSIKDSAGAAVNITGMVPKFTLYRAGAGREMNQQLQKDCVIVSGAAGTCRYTMALGDFNQRTIYEAKVDLYTGQTKIDSTESFLLEIV